VDFSFDDEGTCTLMSKSAHRAFLAAFTLSLLVAVMGVAVASYRSF
jgi:hypothetical protein